LLFVLPFCVEFVIASSSSSLPSANTLESIREYAQTLLASLPPPVPKSNDKTGSGPSSPSPLSPVSPESESPLSLSSAVGDPLNGTLVMPTVVHKEVAGNGKQRAIHLPEELRKVESERERVDEGGLTGCRESVEILTRNPKKGSFRVFYLN